MPGRRGQSVWTTSVLVAAPGLLLLVSASFPPRVSAAAEGIAWVEALVGLAFLVSAVAMTVLQPGARGSRVYTLLALACFCRLLLGRPAAESAGDRMAFWLGALAISATPALLLHLGVIVGRGVLRREASCRYAGYGLASISLALAVVAGLTPAHAVRDRFDSVLLAGALVFALTVLAKARVVSSSSTRRSQCRWLFWSLALGLGPYVLLHVAPRAFESARQPTWVHFVSILPLLLVPTLGTVALGARSRLADLDVMVLRGVAESSAVVCAFAIYAAAVFLLRQGVDTWLDLSRSATRYVGLLVMAVTYPAMRARITVGVERMFYRKRYSYRATLLDWARELNAETDLASLLGRLKERVRETLDVESVEVLVRAGEREFEDVLGKSPATRIRFRPDTMERLERFAFIEADEAARGVLPRARYVFPMKVKGRVSALIALDDREPPGEPLNREDRALLGTLAAHAGSAIEAARLLSEVRRRAEQVERLHAQQEQILESSAVGLLLLDDEGRIQAWNRALEDAYGTDRAAAVGRSLDDVFPLHVARRIRGESRAAAVSDEARIFQLGLVNPRGQRLIVNMAISPAAGRDAAGATVVTFDDVSQRVKLEEQMLRQERLASLGMMAAGVAHEINTPLTGISSYAQMLIEECSPDAPQVETLRKIENETTRAARITHSLLNLARPAGGTAETVDLNETTHEVLQLFEPQLRGCRIDMHVDLQPGLPVLRGDRGKLQQVLLNLLINARDAVDGSGSISVATRLAGAKIVLEVADDGRGIADEDLPRVFDPFFSTKRRGRGTGLGLSVSYGIVQEHEGDIQVESRPGECTRFRVELPALMSARAV
ncbi:MAG: PAS domain-containing protein [bacterium]|nr:PAS domain-containing protein [bacterium]